MAIQQAFGPSLEPLFLSITQLGSDFAYIAVLVIYCWAIHPAGIRNLGIYFSIALLSNAILKDWVAKERPYVLNPEIASLAAQKTAGGYSFPSGHAQVTATLWGLIAYQQRRPWLWVVAVLLTLAVGFSRVYLGVHYLEDVLWGLLLGWGLVGVAVWVPIPSGLPVWNWVLASALLGCSSFSTEEVGRALGMGSAFWVTSASFNLSKQPFLKWALAIGVLCVAVGFYLASSALLPEAFKRSGIGAFLRFGLLTLLITELLPRLVFSRTNVRHQPRGQKDPL